MKKREGRYVVFATNRQSGGRAQDKSQKRGALSGLLGRKSEPQSESLPQIDVEAGVNRALRAAAPQGEPDKGVGTDPIREALSSIEAALYSIDTIRDTIEQAYEVTLSAQDVEDAGGRALLAESYDELRLSINKTVDGLDERAAMLIGKNPRHLDVKLEGKAHYSVSPTRLDLSAKGLNLDPPRDAFATFEEITAVLAELDNALKKADRAAAGYCRDAQFLIARLAGEEAA